jgi:uncharacterized protein (TIGR03067 family)
MLAVSALICAGFLLGQDASIEEQNKADLDKMQGDWVLHSSEFDGAQNLKPPHMVYRIKGSQLTYEGPQDAAAPRRPGESYEITLDASKTPKHFNRTFKLTGPPPRAGQVKVFGNTNLGIYKLDGDTLTICTGTSETRPPDFVTTTRGWRIIVLKRQKDAADERK